MKIPFHPRAYSEWALMSHWCHCSGARWRRRGLFGWRKALGCQLICRQHWPAKPQASLLCVHILFSPSTSQGQWNSIGTQLRRASGLEQAFLFFYTGIFQSFIQNKEGTDISKTETEVSLGVQYTQILALNRLSRMQAHSKKHRFQRAVEHLGSRSLSDTKWELHEGFWARNMCLCTGRVTSVWNLSVFFWPAQKVLQQLHL